MTDLDKKSSDIITEIVCVLKRNDPNFNEKVLTYVLMLEAAKNKKKTLIAGIRSRLFFFIIPF